MPYSVAVSPDGQYIVSTLAGDVTHVVAMRENLEAHALGAKHGITRFLVDVTGATNVDSAADTYAFAYDEMQASAINRAARVAVLVRPGDHSHDFVETVLRNAGLSVRIFTDRDEAVRHLLWRPGPDEPAPPRP